MGGTVWLFSMILATSGVTSGWCIDENLADTIKLLREQVNALLDHRQEDYNALEDSLKHAIEKNTELFVLRNEIKQLRNEVSNLRGGNGSGTGNGNGNEAKNERLRVRWLGSAVTELQGEVAEVLRARNASEEFAERSRMRSELTLLKGDVAEVGRGIRNLGGRIAKIESALGTIRIDIAAVKERSTLLSRTCADITSQLSGIQIEVKSLKCEVSSANPLVERGRTVDGKILGTGKQGGIYLTEHVHRGTRVARRHGYSRHGSESYRLRLEERLHSLERKISIVSRKRASLEKRVAYESQEYLGKRVRSVERIQGEFSRRLENMTGELALVKNAGDALATRLFDSMRILEETIEANRSETKLELARVGVNAARKAAELSLTREELGNLRRAVQALSVSASKLQERSDRQEETIERLNGTLSRGGGSNDATKLESVEDRYRLTVDALPADCDEKEDGLRLLGSGQGTPMLVSCREGWIVFGRRIDGTLDFDRTWNDYSLGFGSPATEFWIGNKILHRLTRDNCTKLRIDLLDIYGERWRAEYDFFAVESEDTGFTLRVGGYTGNATDALSYQNGMAFSAKDRDLDISTAHCAANYHGGWWFSHCQHVNLNGKYTFGLTWFRSDTNGWMPIASSEMSLKRKSDCPR